MWQASLILPGEEMDGLTRKVAEFQLGGVAHCRVGLMRRTALGEAVIWFRLTQSSFPALRGCRSAMTDLQRWWGEPTLFAEVKENPSAAEKFLRFAGFTLAADLADRLLFKRELF